MSVPSMENATLLGKVQLTASPDERQLTRSAKSILVYVSMISN
jgi:hypothetical protein